MSRQDEILNEIKELVGEYYQERFANREFVPGRDKVQNSGKLFDEKELQLCAEAAIDGWWTEGRFASEFQKRFSEYIGIKRTVLTNSGSSANFLAFDALTSKELGDKRIEKGDEVITVAASFPTTITPVTKYGAVPVFLDIEDINSGLYNMDCSGLEEALSDRTKGIFMAHTLGNPFDLDRVMKFAKTNGLWVIEDCCDAVGSTWDGLSVGTFGHLSTSSFYPAHHITLGEGGAVMTNDFKLEKIVRSFRSWGRDCWCEPGEDNTCGKRFGWQAGKLPFGYDHKNIYSHQGYNLKSTDMQAAIGLAQLDKLPDFIQRRKDNFNFLDNNLKKYEDSLILPKSLPEADPSWFGYMISVRPGSALKKEELEAYLTENLVMTRPLFCGNVTKQPFFEDVEHRIVGSLENSDYTMGNTFWIGVQPNITDEMREYTIKTFDSFFEEGKARKNYAV